MDPFTPPISIRARKEAFEANPPVPRESAILTFRGVRPGEDVYNCSVPFVWDGAKYVFGRVEPHDIWVESHVELFRETAPDAYETVPEFRALPLEDPFVQWVDGELVLGGTHVRKSAGEIQYVCAYFYRGPDPLHLRYFTSGPDDMKDIRLVPFGEKIGVFTRPRGEAVRAKYGSEAVIGYVEIPDLDHLTADELAKARIVEGFLGADEWGGCNQCYPLADGRIAVAGHLSYNGTPASSGITRQIYCAARFLFDPRTLSFEPPKIIATRALYGDSVPKEPHLDDCIFTSGWVPRSDGCIDLYCGVTDSAEGRITLPFSVLGLPE